MREVRIGSTISEENRANFIPDRLRDAREARGLSRAELATKLNLTRQAVSKYELGQNIPNNISEIARVLNFPLAYFSLPLKQREHPIGTIYFRRLKSASIKSRSVCRSRVQWLTEILDYIEPHIVFPDVDIPELSEAGENWNLEKYSDEQIEEAADQCRRQWKIAPGPISDISLGCENNGIILSQIKVGDAAVDAFSLWYGNRPIIFLGTDKQSAVRSRFDTAHELGHLILHQDISSDEINDDILLKRIEQEANRFASAFLLPYDAFKSEFLSTRMEHLKEMKVRWGVSIAALIYRANSIGLISSDETLNLRKRMSANGYRKEEPLDDEIPFEQPRLLNRAIKLLLENSVINRETIFSEFRLPPEEIEQICFLPRDTLKVSSSVDNIEIALRKNAF